MNPHTDSHQGNAPQHVPSTVSPRADYGAAADVARQQADHLYQHNPPHQSESTTPGNPYNQTHQQLYDWQRYHTAWQEYYQRYYAHYYEAQLRVTQQQTAEPMTQLASQTVPGSDETFTPQTHFQQVRGDLLHTITQRGQAFQQSRYFVPVVCALIVALLFLFLQFNRLLVAQVERYISPGSTASASDTVIVDPANSSVGGDPKVIIPKINVTIPVNYSITTVDDKIIQGALEHGAVHYNLPGASSLPGQIGNTVILAHSSNDVFDPGNYKFAFLLVDRLQPNDLIYLNFQGKRYAYRVTEKKIIKPTDWRVLQQDNGKPNVVLVTGSPTDTAQNRLLVYGEQISPNPDAASAKPANQENSNPAAIPGNSPTFFERIGDLIF